MKGRSLGIMRRPGLLALLALGAAGCPDDPEPAGTGPDCKKGECPVDQPQPDDPPATTLAPDPSPMSRPVGSTWSDRVSDPPPPASAQKP